MGVREAARLRGGGLKLRNFTFFKSVTNWQNKFLFFPLLKSGRKKSPSISISPSSSFSFFRRAVAWVEYEVFIYQYLHNNGVSPTHTPTVDYSPITTTDIIGLQVFVATWTRLLCLGSSVCKSLRLAKVPTKKGPNRAKGLLMPKLKEHGEITLVGLQNFHLLDADC